MHGWGIAAIAKPVKEYFMQMIRLILILMVALGSYGGIEPTLARSEPLPLLTITNAQSEQSAAFHIEYAITPEQHATGLMHRSSLPKNQSMLFINKTAREVVMWMKNTLIPLDMLFIDEKNNISHIHHNAQPHSLEHIASQGKVKAVLEINGGLAHELNINIGDEVHYDLP
jgi:uncharacterized membrane protein (UPF0127 family)